MFQRTAETIPCDHVLSMTYARLSRQVYILLKRSEKEYLQRMRDETAKYTPKEEED